MQPPPPPSGWTPDVRQRLQRASKFFARLASFDLECPHCGTVYQVRIGTKRDVNWDPFTARFTCTQKGCARVYVLGMLAWPIKKAPRVASATPEDQVPGPRQLAQMRKEGGGWWMADEDAQRYARPHETNLTTEDDRPEGEEDE